MREPATGWKLARWIGHDPAMEVRSHLVRERECHLIPRFLFMVFPTDLRPTPPLCFLHYTRFSFSVLDL